MRKSIKDRIAKAQERTKGMQKIYTKRSLHDIIKEKIENKRKLDNQFLSETKQTRRVEKVVESLFDKDEILESTQRKHDELMRELNKYSLEDKMKPTKVSEVKKSERQRKYEALIDRVLDQSKERGF